MENSILKRLIAVVCAISITMTGTTVLADELRVEENDNADIEVCISGDWETGDDLDCAEDISNKEVNPSFDKPKQISDSKLPDDNSILESNDFLSDDVTNGIQEDAVEDNAKLENITFEDNNQEVFVGAASHTRDEAVAWANSQLNKSFDYDGAYGAQCVDFIYYYYVYLGQAAPGGNANQFVNGGRYTPSGWSYQSSPLPGDIAVWTTGSYGHVAIVTEIRGSQMVCVEQNHSNRQYVTPNLHNIDAQTYIRPDFPNPDNSGPSYSDFHVGELREGAFTILAHVTDPSGIKEVSYAI